MKSLPLILLLLAASVPVCFGAQPSLTLSLDSTYVHVSGGTPNAAILIFSLASEPHGHYSTVVRRDHVIPGNASGVYQYEIDGGIPSRSVWFAVDVKDGRYAVAAPQGFPLREISWPTDTVRSSSQEARDWVQVAREYADVVVVRPGGKAWGVSASKGGGNDDDKHEKGRMQLSSTVLREIGDAKGPGPDRILPSDLIIIVDTETFEFFAGRASQEGNH